MARTNITIVGAGPAGFALAADLQRTGNGVLLYSHPDRLRHVNKIKDVRGGYHHLQVSGPKTAPFVSRVRVTSDMGEAVAFSNIIILTVPSTGQETVLKELKPFDLGQHIVIAIPGNLFSLIATAEINVGCILETNLSPYSCRMDDDGRLLILGKKKVVYISALGMESGLPQPVYEAVHNIFSMVELRWCSSIIEVCLANVNGIFHPLMMLMNAGRIENTGGDFFLYRDGLTPAVANSMLAIDRVRMQIGEAFGLRLETAIGVSNACYSQNFTCLVDLGQNSPPHNKLRAPSDMDNRNISEDVPDLLVCWHGLAERLGIDASPIRAVIVLAEIATGGEYLRTGRNLARLNLEGISRRELVRKFTVAPTPVRMLAGSIEVVDSRL